jgi:hypothetical protein
LGQVEEKRKTGFQWRKQKPDQLCCPREGKENRSLTNCAAPEREKLVKEAGGRAVEADMCNPQHSTVQGAL